MQTQPGIQVILLSAPVQPHDEEDTSFIEWMTPSLSTPSPPTPSPLSSLNEDEDLMECMTPPPPTPSTSPNEDEVPLDWITPSPPTPSRPGY